MSIIFKQMIPAILICLCGNLDILIATVTRHKLITQKNLTSNICCITLISTLFTALSTWLGNTISASIPPKAADGAAGAVFILLALYALGSEFKSKHPQTQSNSKILLLSLTLACNNVGLGIAAGVAQYHPLLITAFTFLFTLSACILGVKAAQKLRQYLSERSLNVISNLILLLMGLYQLLNQFITWRI